MGGDQQQGGHTLQQQHWVDLAAVVAAWMLVLLMLLLLLLNPAPLLPLLSPSVQCDGGDWHLGRLSSPLAHLCSDRPILCRR